MNPVKNNGAISFKVSIKGREVPAELRLRPDQHKDSTVIRESIERRLKRDAVQESLLRTVAASPEAVKVIDINSLFPDNTKRFERGRLYLSTDAAQELRGNKLALVLSGGTDRGSALIGVEEVLAQRGIVPDIWMGTSAGAIAATIGDLYGGGAAKRLIYNVVRNHPYTDFLDFNLKALRDPANFGGVLKGKRLESILGEEFGIRGVKFADVSRSKKPLFITAVNLVDGHSYIFGDTSAKDFYDGLVEDPRAAGSDFRERSTTRFYPEDVPVLDALRASFSIPFFLESKQMGNYLFTDGAVRLYCAYKAAANFIDVGRILAISLGYTGKVEGMSRNGLYELDHTQDIRNYDQQDKWMLQLMRGVSGREINLGIFDAARASTPNAYLNVQRLVISSRDTMRYILEIVPPERLFDRFPRETFERLSARMSVKWWGQPSSNIVTMTDTNALIGRPLDDPAWQIGFNEDGYVLNPASLDQTILQKIISDFRDEFGLSRTLVAGALAKFVLPWLFEIKKKEEIKPRDEEGKNNGQSS